MPNTLPILYSFRRCPYAMRARMALWVSGMQCELREVVLRDKPDEMIAASAKATVPVLVLPGGEVVDESYDVMAWALHQNDPENWLDPEEGSSMQMFALIDACEEEFKPHLDRYKYANRYEGADPLKHREEAEKFVLRLDGRLNERPFLFGNRICMGDVAIAPFIRQFANVDRSWFDSSPYPNAQKWLEQFVGSALFVSIMSKYTKWETGQDGVIFPA
jgi:glutathione S-transferase